MIITNNMVKLQTEIKKIATKIDGMTVADKAAQDEYKLLIMKLKNKVDELDGIVNPLPKTKAFDIFDDTPHITTYISEYNKLYSELHYLNPEAAKHFKKTKHLYNIEKYKMAISNIKKVIKENKPHR